jgi:hypothetical protein
LLQFINTWHQSNLKGQENNMKLWWNMHSGTMIQMEMKIRSKIYPTNWIPNTSV